MAEGAVAAISTARRMLYAPVEVGYVRRGGVPDLPAIAALGRSDDARAFLRFSVPLAPDAGVVEAYLLLDRVTDVDSDPEPIALHVVGVIDAWDERSLSWAVQPRVEEVGSPVTRVLPASGSLVRLDVRAIVERWRHRKGAEFGLAVVAGEAGTGATHASEGGGIAFALAPRADVWSEGRALDGSAQGPRLELYLR